MIVAVQVAAVLRGVGPRGLSFLKALARAELLLYRPAAGKGRPTGSRTDYNLGKFILKL